MSKVMSEEDKSKQEIIEQLNAYRLPFLDMFGCRIIDADAAQQTCTMEFDIDKKFCHSVDIVQGGFVTAMLDAASAHAVFVHVQGISNVLTLEIKTSFYTATRAGKIIAVGKIDRKGKRTAFLSAELRNAAGEVTAVASTTARLV